MADLPKLIGQLKDLADYWEPNDPAAAAIIRQAVAALTKRPDEADVERVAWALAEAHGGEDATLMLAFGNEAATAYWERLARAAMTKLREADHG